MMVPAVKAPIFLTVLAVVAVTPLSSVVCLSVLQLSSVAITDALAAMITPAAKISRHRIVLAAAAMPPLEAIPLV